MNRIEIIKALTAITVTDIFGKTVEGFDYVSAGAAVGSVRFMNNVTNLTDCGLIRRTTRNVNGIDQTFFNLTPKALALI